MALIILDPGEIFEHFHSDQSTTYLIDGAAEIEVQGIVSMLHKGEVVTISAGTSHTLKNVGTGKATIGCGHA